MRNIKAKTTKAMTTTMTNSSFLKELANMKPDNQSMDSEIDNSDHLLKDIPINNYLNQSNSKSKQELLHHKN